MINTLTEFEFIDGFKNRSDNFSYDGLKALFKYYEELEADTDQRIEFDPIAICCDWTEYKDLDEFNENYHGTTLSDDYDLITLRNYTQVITVGEDKLIVQNF